MKVWRKSKRYSGVTLALASLLLMFVGTATGEKVARIGYLAWDSRSCRSEAFVAGLRELGYVEGRNIAIECYDAGGRFDGLIAAAAESVRHKPDVIVAMTHNYAEALQLATKEIPIVMVVGGDPVAAGLVASLARPGGNITGVGHFSPELNAKRLELLKEVAPHVKRVAVLSFPEGVGGRSTMNDFQVRDTTSAAKALGLELQVVEVRGRRDLYRAFDEIVAARADAVHVLPNRLFAVEAQKIADLARFNRLPTVHFYEGFPEVGGLMAYGVDFQAVHRRAAVYVDKILKGANPAGLPVEQPTKFKLVVNNRTARELGLTIPESVLLLADKVIE